MLVRLILIVLLFFLGYALFNAITRALPGRKPGGTAPPAEKSSRGEVMEKDPECGTYVPRGDAVSALVRGKRRYFCSTQCRDAYARKKG